jgi:hypothetical protein
MSTARQPNATQAEVEARLALVRAKKRAKGAEGDLSPEELDAVLPPVESDQRKREREARWYQANKERQQAVQLAWRQRNRERLKQYMRDRYQRRKEMGLEAE